MFTCIFVVPCIVCRIQGIYVLTLFLYPNICFFISVLYKNLISHLDLFTNNPCFVYIYVCANKPHLLHQSDKQVQRTNNSIDIRQQSQRTNNSLKTRLQFQRKLENNFHEQTTQYTLINSPN